MTSPAAANRTTGRSNPVAPVAVVLAIALVASIGVAVTIGAADIQLATVWESLLRRIGAGTASPDPLRDAILWDLRLPRVLTAAAVGAGLALCGAIMQSITRNPLADPYLLGLSSGASFGAVLVIVLGVSIVLPLAAFLGALGALAMTMVLAGARRQVSPPRMLLAGIAVSALSGALTSFVIFWSSTGDSYREILSWLLGSFGGSSWQSVAISAVALILIGVPLALSANLLDAFAFGDRQAAALGIPVGAVRATLLVATALLTGAMVSVSGAIGFVGLMIPHAVRLLVGGVNRRVLPLTVLTGAIFLLWADTLARTVFDPRELPVGVVTAILGAPAFAWLLLRSRGAR